MAVPYGFPRKRKRGGWRVEDVYLPGDPVRQFRAGIESDSNYACRNGICCHDSGDRGCMKDLYTLLREKYGDGEDNPWRG